MLDTKQILILRNRPYFHRFVLWVNGKLPPHYRNPINRLTFIRILQSAFGEMSEEVEFACKFASSNDEVFCYLLDKAYESCCANTPEPEDKSMVPCYGSNFIKKLADAMYAKDLEIPFDLMCELRSKNSY
jgi:hypothetical protein